MNVAKSVFIKVSTYIYIIYIYKKGHIIHILDLNVTCEIIKGIIVHMYNYKNMYEATNIKIFINIYKLILGVYSYQAP